MAEISSKSQFVSGNIANMIPESPLNKMVPLTEDHGGGGGGGGGGGCMETPVSSPLVYWNVELIFNSIIEIPQYRHYHYFNQMTSVMNATI